MPEMLVFSAQNTRTKKANNRRRNLGQADGFFVDGFFVDGFFRDVRKGSSQALALVACSAATHQGKQPQTQQAEGCWFGNGLVDVDITATTFIRIVPI